MKVLFLDIDGVVNCATTAQRWGSFIGIDPLMSFTVGKIQLDTGCEIVLSSSWRHTPDGIKEVEKLFNLYSMTPGSKTGFRGDEINMWLKDHPEVTRYAILDDNSDFYPAQMLFKTSWSTGITDEIAKQVTDYLNLPEVKSGS